DEDMDASMPSFSSKLTAEPERRDSSFSLGGGAESIGFGFRRPSAMQSALSFDTISPVSSVASFHAHHQSPSASLANFHLGSNSATPGGQHQSPNVSVSSFHHQQQQQHMGSPFSPAPPPNGVNHHSPNVSVASFHHHQSPSASVSSFQGAFGGGASSLGGLHGGGGGPVDTPMDLGFGQGLNLGGPGQGNTPTGSFSHLNGNAGLWGTSPQQQQEFNRLAAAAGSNPLHDFYSMT
ncbi:hypothetical protein FRB90_001668, partial [Tulasnella sp. 427]